MGKLSKDELKKKADYHKKRAEYYEKKHKEAVKASSRIGFKFYD